MSYRSYLNDPHLHPPPGIEIYLRGYCDIFAVAAKKAFDWDIYSILGYREIPNNGSLVCLVHCFNVPNKENNQLIFDAKGIRNISQLNDEYLIGDDCWIEKTDEAKLKTIIYQKLKNPLKEHNPSVHQDKIRISDAISFIKKEYSFIKEHYDIHGN